MFKKTNRPSSRCFFSFIAIAVALSLGSCTSWLGIKKEPKVQLESVQFKGADGDSAIVAVALDIENPNSVALEVDAIDYELEVEGKVLAKGNIDKPSSVPANGKATLEVPVRVRYGDLFASVLAFLQPGARKYKIKGSAKIGLFRIPFEKAGEVKIGQ